jgi:hypothetical protein
MVGAAVIDDNESQSGKIAGRKGDDELDMQSKFSDWNRAYIDTQWQWAENIAFLTGNHYYSRTRDTNRLILQNQLPPWRVQMVTNQVLSVYLYHMGMLRQSIPEYYARPASTEAQDEDSARANEIYLKYSDRINDNAALTQKIFSYMLIYGCCYEKVFWDNSYVGSARDETTGENYDSIVGEAKRKIGDPYNLAIDPNARSFETAQWVMEHTVMSSAEVESIWGVKVPEQNVLCNFDQWIFSAGRDNYQMRQGVSVKEIWHKPTPDRPNGSYAVTANGLPVPVTENGKYISDLPYFEATNGKVVFPFIWYPLIEHPLTPYAMSLIEHTIQLNKGMNLILSMRTENLMQLGRPKILWPTGTPDQSWTTEPGQKIRFTAGIGAPSYLQPPDLGAEPLNLFGTLESQLKGLSGSMDITDTAKSGVTTKGGQLGQFQLNAMRSALATDPVEKGAKRRYEIILNLAHAYKQYDEMLAIAGENEDTILYAFNGANINSTDVEIISGSAHPKDPYAELEMLLQALQYKGISPEQFQERFFNLSLLAAMPQSPHYKRARWEQRQIRKSAPLTVIIHDDHATHIRLHTEWLVGNWHAEWLTPQMRGEMFWHISAHAMAMKMNQPAVDAQGLPVPQPQMAVPLFDPMTGEENAAWRVSQMQAVSPEMRYVVGAPEQAMSSASGIRPFTPPPSVDPSQMMFGNTQNPLGIQA